MSAGGQTCETIKDYLTGRVLPDSDDEQIRQAVERLLVEEKGYRPEDIEVDRFFEIELDGERHRGRAELVVRVQDRPFMSLKSTRGSLVTREREALAASRLACEVQIPLTVVTNGQEAEVLDTLTGQVLAQGLEAIPTEAQAEDQARTLEYLALPDKRREKEGRIFLAFAAFECPSECE